MTSIKEVNSAILLGQNIWVDKSTSKIYESRKGRFINERYVTKKQIIPEESYNLIMH